MIDQTQKINGVHVKNNNQGTEFRILAPICVLYLKHPYGIQVFTPINSIIYPNIPTITKAKTPFRLYTFIKGIIIANPKTTVRLYPIRCKCSWYPKYAGKKAITNDSTKRMMISLLNIVYKIND